jgi:UDP-glucose 4-epimerase
VKVLVSGGAGFIGSTIASAAIDAGLTPVILDSLVTGKREFTSGRIFYHGDICDGSLVDAIFADHPDITAAVHCAALIVVPQSVSDPVRYYRANVTKSLDFVTSLLRNGCQRMIFSSSAAIYAPGADLSVHEGSPIAPQSPYARTKAACEAMFADIAAAEPIGVLSLRYFNPIGADPRMRTGLQLARPTHALGQMIMRAREGEKFELTGTDYPTRDGSGIRDYIHVWDLARAHVAALSRFDELIPGPGGSAAINLGTGTGTTVWELLSAFNQCVDYPLGAVEGPRRPGDVAGVFARSELAAQRLGWQATYSVAEGIAHSLQWAQRRDQVLAGQPG